MKTIQELDFSVPEEIKRYTKNSREISNMISEYIRAKGKQKFTEQVGKTEEEVERWTSGSYNFTVLTISLIEEKTGISIIKTLRESNNSAKD